MPFNISDLEQQVQRAPDYANMSMKQLLELRPDLTVISMNDFILLMALAFVLGMALGWTYREARLARQVRRELGEEQAAKKRRPGA